MEKGLLNWYQKQVKNEVEVTSGDIRKKAMELSKLSDFVASKTWFRKFKKRNDIKVVRNKKVKK